MYLSKPPWAEDLLSSSSPTISSSSSSASASSSTSSSSSASSLPSAVVDLVKSLNKQRLYREVTLALRTALRDATAEFSFLRVRGLRKLLRFLSSVAESEKMIELFRESQAFTELRVVPVLFEHSLSPPKNVLVFNLDHNAREDPQHITSPPTDCEVVLALRVLEGCCLLDRDSRTVAHQHMAIKELIELLSAGGVLEQSACLDALIALMLDSYVNQKEFERHHGIRKIAELAKNSYVDEKVRLKCAEFMLLLIANVLPSMNEFIDTVSEEETEETLLLESAQEDILELLGEGTSSLLWAASQSGSSFDAEKKLSSLHFQAQQLLDSLDLNSW